jgi:hypothetical protein
MAACHSTAGRGGLAAASRWRTAAMSSLVRLPIVFARTIAQNRSGARTAAPTAAQPPIDWATIAAREIPR